MNHPSGDSPDSLSSFRHPAVQQRVQHHKKAFKLIDEALKLEEGDEEGHQSKEKAIRLYERGIAELERGIAVEMPADVVGEDLTKDEKLCDKMVNTMESARQRIEKLYKQLESVRPAAPVASARRPVQYVQPAKRIENHPPPSRRKPVAKVTLIL
jgi:exonuclease VII small subunit